MDSLTTQEFQQCRNQLLAFLKEAPMKRIKLLEQKKINEKQFNQLSVQELEYVRILNLLITKFINDVLTDISEPGKKIDEAATKLKNTLQSLEDFNHSLQVLTLGIELVSNILLAVQSGPGAIAKIINVINQIGALPSPNA